MEGTPGPRQCPECSEDTHNYWICNACIDKKLSKGANIDDLYEVEEDQYILEGLERLAHRNRG